MSRSRVLVIKRSIKMTYDKLDYYYKWLKDNDAFTEPELQLITDIYGYNIETLDLAVYSRYGYQTVQALIDDCYTDAELEALRQNV